MAKYKANEKRRITDHEIHPDGRFKDPKHYGRKGHKGSNREVEERVLAVYKLLVDGVSTTEIYKHCGENYDIGTSQSDVYIKRAREFLRIDFDMDRQDYLAEALAGYRQIRRKAERRGQFMAAKVCLDATCDLVGLGSTK